LLRRLSASFFIAVAPVPVQAIARAVEPPVTTPPITAPPVVTTVLPVNTPGTVLVDTTPSSWAALNRFNPLPPALMPPLRVPLLPSAISYTKDIQPWIGDRVAIALMPINSDKETFDSSAVLLAPIRDSSSFDAFFAKVKASFDRPWSVLEYKGITIIYWSPPVPPAKPPAEPEPSKPEPKTTPKPKPLPSPTSQQQRLPSSSAAQTALSQSKAVEPKPTPSSLPEITPSEETSPSTDESTNLAASRGLAIAVLPGHVVVAAQPEAIKKMIDARSANTALSENPLFQRTLQNPHFGRSLIVTYGDVAGLAKYLTTLAKNVPPTTLIPIPPLPALEESQITAITRLYNSVDSFMWVQPQGVQGQATFHYSTPRPDLATPADPNANQILARLPAATYLSFNSRNFKRQWQMGLQESKDDKATQTALKTIRDSVRTSTGLDLDKDLINWMDGEYLFSFFPSKGGFLNLFSPSLTLGATVIIQTSDRPAATTALKKLEARAKATSGKDLAIVTRSIKGQPVTSWESKYLTRVDSILTYGWVDDNTLIVTTGMEPMATLNPKPYLPLHTNYTFQTATAGFPMPNEGYFYVNMGASLLLAYNMLQPYISEPAYAPIVAEVQRILGTIRSVSSSNVATADYQRVEVLYVLSEVKPISEVKPK